VERPGLTQEATPGPAKPWTPENTRVFKTALILPMEVEATLPYLVSD